MHWLISSCYHDLEMPDTWHLRFSASYLLTERHHCVGSFSRLLLKGEGAPAKSCAFWHFVVLVQMLVEALFLFLLHSRSLPRCLGVPSAFVPFGVASAVLRASQDSGFPIPIYKATYDIGPSKGCGCTNTQ